MPLPDPPGGLNAINLPVQPDVHQDKIGGFRLFKMIDKILTGREYLGDLISGFREQFVVSESYEGIIFDYEDRLVWQECSRTLNDLKGFKKLYTNKRGKESRDCRV